MEISETEKNVGSIFSKCNEIDVLRTTADGGNWTKMWIKHQKHLASSDFLNPIESNIYPPDERGK